LSTEDEDNKLELKKDEEDGKRGDGVGKEREEDVNADEQEEVGTVKEEDVEVKEDEEVEAAKEEEEEADGYKSSYTNEALLRWSNPAPSPL
jgi:hypothetical protein